LTTVRTGCDCTRVRPRVGNTLRVSRNGASSAKSDR
jgi:hypothetical protein